MTETHSGTDGAADLRKVALTINDTRFEATVECRTTLADLLRDLGFTGTHLGCEQGACGACTRRLRALETVVAPAWSRATATSE